ncbi:MAG: NapC/NirT family cytochrome c [Hyphomicrobiales bacterium]|nr:NapC/NirT family cytochrome c [Hyphomicrobiales bacterium]
MSDIATPKKSGFLARLWNFLWRPSSRLSMATLVIFGGVCGILFWGGFNWAMEVANTEQFCISCHEMKDTPYKELQNTIHFRNRSGVRATCPDCHVPHPFMWKIKRKIEASNEVLHKILGTVDTPEKFEAHRLELAQHVWKVMGSTDSRECRNCHQEHSMDPSKQKPKAAKEMQEGFAKGMTCIDCHKGIAHHLPKDPLDDDDDTTASKAPPAAQEPAKKD